MAARRLSPSPGASRRPLVTFTFDGHVLEAPEGEPVAVALLVAGRRILSRSFRFHRPRGLMCATGRCGWCECEVDGRPSVKTCQVPVRAGMVVRGEHALPSVDRDVLGLVGLVARRIPPTFYHHRFLRPRFLRQRYLDVIRWFGGRGRLRTDGGTPPAVPASRPVERIAVDVLVVGAGPAGRLAAEGARAEGATVLLVDTGDVSLHDGVDVRPRTTVIGLYDRTVLAVGPDAQLEIRAGSIVAATGSLERLPVVRGIDLPGVVGARLVERLITEQRVLPGERAVLVGSRRDRDAMRGLLQEAGASIMALIATHDLAAVTGRREVTGVRTTDGRTLAADLVVLCDRTPALELPLAAGVPVAWRDGRLVPVTTHGATTVPWFWIAGSAMGDRVTGRDPERHREVGRRAARAPRDVTTDPPLAAEEAGDRIAAPATGAWPARALVCFCEDVHVDELRHECRIANGEVELVKRRTGAQTGPCQGAYCLAGVAACAAAAHGAGDPSLATTRPPLRGTRLGDLVADDPAPTAGDPGSGAAR